MKLMVIGGGGREHAIIKKLKENPAVEEIYCLPGNGGIAADAVCVPEIGAKDIPCAGRVCQGARDRLRRCRAGRSAGPRRGGRAERGGDPLLRP